VGFARLLPLILAAAAAAAGCTADEPPGNPADADAADDSRAESPAEDAGPGDVSGDDGSDATCEDPSCSSHGVCEDAPSGSACACRVPYTGPTCADCAVGFQDHDGDGSCLPDCAAAVLDCGSHGSCDDADGTPHCDCAEGWQDHDGDGSCQPTCATAALVCGDRRRCDDSSGGTDCVCERGRAGEDCAACAPGFIASAALCVPDHEWAVLFYMAADNMLEPYALDDLEEIAGAGSSDAVHLVALLDTWRDGARMLYVEPGEAVVVSEPGEIDTGDYRTLRDFGVWAVNAYPARHTALVLWNHGNGWKGRAGAMGTKAVGMDDHGDPDGISLSRGDYGRALEGIVAALGGRIDLVGFDACLMGMWEVAVATAPWADYLVASSENEPLEGWRYLAPLRALRAAPDTAPSDLAAELVEAYAAASPLHFTLAATDLAALETVSAAVDGLAGALLAHPEAFAAVETARLDAQGFGDLSFRDLRDLAERLAGIAGIPGDVGDAASLLGRELLTAFVDVRSQPSHPGAHGLSVYLPGRGAGMDPDYAAPTAPWSSTRWDDFLRAFTGE
jgi:hypothetical protein